ncbi:MAG: PLDc N-terminal domain-containing protein [Patescibacteria group bacterium]
MDYTYTTDPAAAAAGTAAVGVFAGVMIFVWILAIATFVVWLWALIDVIRRNFTNPSDKTLWLILVVVGAFFLGPILPIVYLIVGRKKGTLPTK